MKIQIRKIGLVIYSDINVDKFDIELLQIIDQPPDSYETYLNGTKVGGFSKKTPYFRTTKI